MASIVGTGDFKYRIVEDWAKLPDGWSFKEVGAVGVDAKDNVYVFNRGEHPVMVFDRDGNFLRSWGEGEFPRAHGVHMGPDDSIYLTDDGGHFMRKCSLDGKVLLEIGVPGKPAPYMSGEPFHRCTHTALSPNGEIYVSDGYGNAKVHKYSPDGKLLMSWGGPGTNPGEFNIVHNICTDTDGWVYVADRENHRVQVFDGNGKYETQWNNLHRPCGLYMDYTRHPVCYIGELGPVQPVNRNSPNLGPRVSIVDNQGKLLSRFGDMHAGSASTRAATSMSAKSRGPSGRNSIPTRRGRLTSARCRNMSACTEGERYGGDRRHRRLQILHHRELGEAPRRLVLQGGRRGRRRQQRQCLCLQSRRAPGHGVRPRWKLPAILGRGPVPAGARRPCGAGRFDLSDRRWRPLRAQMLARRQGAAGDRRPRQAGSLHERRAVPPLHPHRPLAEGRDLCLR